MNEVCWIVEYLPVDEFGNPLPDSPVSYIAGNVGSYCDEPGGWCLTDADNALRFSRQVDAERFIEGALRPEHHCRYKAVEFCPITWQSGEAHLRWDRVRFVVGD